MTAISFHRYAPRPNISPFQFAVRQVLKDVVGFMKTRGVSTAYVLSQLERSYPQFENPTSTAVRKALKHLVRAGYAARIESTRRTRGGSLVPVISWKFSDPRLSESRDQLSDHVRNRNEAA